MMTEDAVVLLTSRNADNPKFGSGFVIAEDKHYSYILSCAHVLEDLGYKANITGLSVEIMALGSADGLDMALLKVAKLDKPCLNQFAEGVPDTDIFISGYSAFKDDNSKQDRQQKRLLKGKLGNAIKLTGRNSTEEFAAFDIINIKNDVFSKLADGYSGSPLCNQQGKVIGVVSHRVGGEQGHALCISNLKRLVNNMTASPPKDWQSSRYTKIITAIVIASIIAIATLAHDWQPEPVELINLLPLEPLLPVKEVTPVIVSLIETMSPLVEIEPIITLPNPIVKPAMTSETITVKGVDFEMVAIKGGSFQMGSSPLTEPERGTDEKQHEITVADFQIGKYEVTQTQWQSVMDSNPAHFKGGNLPVENVSWDDVQIFISLLNQATEKTGHRFNLPTEAQWEYAARAGTNTPFYPYDGQGYCITTTYANFNSDYDYNGCGAKTTNSEEKTVVVDSYLPNAFGLYNMEGNVWEWTCSDYDKNYGGSEIKCSINNDTNTIRVLRGGSWYSKPKNLRSAGRYNTTSDDHSHYIGFRLSKM